MLKNLLFFLYSLCAHIRPLHCKMGFLFLGSFLIFGFSIFCEYNSFRLLFVVKTILSARYYGTYTHV